MFRAWLFTWLVRPLLTVWCGFRVVGAAHLPRTGPALVVANHQSHLDIVSVLCAFDRTARRRVYAAAAADVFFRGPVRAFLTRLLFGARPVERDGEGDLDQRLAPVRRVLERGGIVVLFPEGTRGDPRVAQPFRRGGLAYLCSHMDDLAVVPVYLAGPERAMPRGTWLPLPSPIEVRVGPALPPSAPDDVALTAQHAVSLLAHPPGPAPEVRHAAS